MKSFTYYFLFALFSISPTFTLAGYTKEHQIDTVANKDIRGYDYFSIGSGMVGGTYFVLGELIAGVISRPKLSLPCRKGGSCGIDNLIGLNTPTSGSISNIQYITDKKLDSGFIQSNILYWAYTATGPFIKKKKANNLRAIASLYTEYMHIVVRKKAGIHSLQDLKGKTVSLGLKGSGTLYDAKNLLESANVNDDEFKLVYLSNSEAIEKLKANEIDAVFTVVGIPSPFYEELINKEGKDSKNENEYQLLSIPEKELNAIIGKVFYYTKGTIPANSYSEQSADISTFAVRAVWVADKDAPKKLIYELTTALWEKDSRLALDTNKTGRDIRLENSLEGIGVPLHPGAKKYYDEIGKRF